MDCPICAKEKHKVKLIEDSRSRVCVMCQSIFRVKNRLKNLQQKLSII